MNEQSKFIFNEQDSFARLHNDNKSELPNDRTIRPRPDDSKISVYYRSLSNNKDCHKKGLKAEETRSKKYQGILVLMFKKLDVSFLVKDVNQETELGDESHCHITYNHFFKAGEALPPIVREEIKKIVKGGSFIKYESEND